MLTILIILFGFVGTVSYLVICHFTRRRPNVVGTVLAYLAATSFALALRTGWLTFQIALHEDAIRRVVQPHKDVQFLLDLDPIHLGGASVMSAGLAAIGFWGTLINSRKERKAPRNQKQKTG